MCFASVFSAAGIVIFTLAEVLQFGRVTLKALLVTSILSSKPVLSYAFTLFWHTSTVGLNRFQLIENCCQLWIFTNGKTEHNIIQSDANRQTTDRNKFTSVLKCGLTVPVNVAAFIV